MTSYELYACGSNGEMQLGLGTKDDVSVFTQIDIQALCKGGSEPKRLDLAFGAAHTLLLAEYESTSRVYGVGCNARGQLGTSIGECCGHFTDLQLDRGSDSPEGGKARPIYVAACWETSIVVMRGSEGDSILCMGASDWGECDVELGGQFRVQGIATGPRHVIVHVETAVGTRVMGWGACRHGQLGEVPLGTRIAPHPLTLCEWEGLGRDIKLAAGKDHSIVFDKDSSEIFLFGSNKMGQLGAPDPAARRNTLWDPTVANIHSTWTTVYMELRNPYKIIGFGSNLHGQLTLSPERCRSSSTACVVYEKTFASMGAGSEHLLVQQGNELYSWGWNEHGNLGVGSNAFEMTPRKVVFDFNYTRIVRLFGGNATSWILVAVDR